MAATKGLRIAKLVLRILTFVFLFISLLIITTNSKTIVDEEGLKEKVRFKTFHSYRYLVATIIIGAALNLLQIALTIYHIVTKSDGTLIFDMFSDQSLAFLLLSGAAAGLGAGIDLKARYKLAIGNIYNSFFDKGNAGAAILFLAFICSAFVTILSALALIKKP